MARVTLRTHTAWLYSVTVPRAQAALAVRRARALAKKNPHARLTVTFC